MRCSCVCRIRIRRLAYERVRLIEVRQKQRLRARRHHAIVKFTIPLFRVELYVTSPHTTTTAGHSSCCCGVYHGLWRERYVRGLSSGFPLFLIPDKIFLSFFLSLETAALARAGGRRCLQPLNTVTTTTFDI